MDVNELVFALSHMEVDANGLETQMNSLTELLGRSFLPDSVTQPTHEARHPSDLSLAEAHQNPARPNAVTWMFDGGPRTEEHRLAQTSQEVVMEGMDHTPSSPPQKYGRVPQAQVSQPENQNDTFWPAQSAWNYNRATKAECEPNSAEQAQAVIGQFTHYPGFEGENLADAKIPSQKGELEVLGHYISDELLKRHRAGDKRMLVFSPRQHPCYPYWVGDHEVNELIQNSYTAMVESRYPGQLRQSDDMDIS